MTRKLVTITAIICLLSRVALAQSGTITTFAGTVSGFTGDGGPATAARFNQPTRVVVDAAGNKYIADDGNNRVRKITPAGIITTIAGTGVAGFSGDGGDATAAQLNSPNGLVIDAAGNIYIADEVNNRIRKINSAGAISTFAGNGSSGFSGDGGQATAASVYKPSGLAIDAVGNFYTTDYSNRIRKITPSGIISTYAGNGTASFTGDGGPATAAGLNQPWGGMAFSPAGELYFADQMNNRVRKITTSGIISTVAGNGVAGYSGDGGNALAAKLYWPEGIALDAFGNLFFSEKMNSVVRKVSSTGKISTAVGTGTSGMTGDGGPATAATLSIPAGICIDPTGQLYIADQSNTRIRKVTHSAMATSSGMSLDINSSCTSSDFQVLANTYVTGQHVKVFFGDGTSLDTPTVAASGTGVVQFWHSYGAAGMYTVKALLINGTATVDSVTYSYHFRNCRDYQAEFYYDANGNCMFDAGDYPSRYPVTIRIDSNSAPIDTIAAISGFYYSAYGATGDVYTFTVIGHIPGYNPSCPSSGELTDTFNAFGTTGISPFLSFGFDCSPTPGFDLAVHTVFRAGRHAGMADILVENTHCAPHAATLSAYFSPKYSFPGANITPTTASGGYFTWVFSGLSAGTSGPVYIHLYGEKPPPSTPWYMPGDTVNSSYLINPVTGDMVPGDNNEDRVDTVRSSFDPNYVEVSPSGCIPAAITELEYAIGFENDGNDTAHNIHVLDTISNSLDLSTFKAIGSSATMNISFLNSGGYNVIKFDFPNIMLPDSTHHNLCQGVFFYRIKTKAGLANGTVVPNRVGIYFDDNEVVMTNTAANTVGCAVPTLISAVGGHNVFLFPNPATDELTVKTETNTFTSVTITNTIGQQMLQQNMLQSQVRLSVKDLPAGVYYVTLRGEQGSEVRKFVKS